MVEDKVIRQIRSHEFHDWPVSQMQIHFEGKLIFFEFQKFDDKEYKYKPLKIIFKDVTGFLVNGFEDNNFQFEGIFGIECKKIDAFIYEAELHFTREESAPPWIVTIRFKDVEIIAT